MKSVEKTPLWTALVTPMESDGRIDFDSLEKLVGRQQDAGNGIVLLGSTGEGLALSDEEKESVVRFVTGLNPGIPVMAGVGGFQIEKQRRWIGICNEIGVDAFLLVAPLYSKPGGEGMKMWFEALLSAADRPCMLYNIPGRTGVKVPPQVVAALQSHENLWSLKEASGSVEEYTAFLKQAPDVVMFSGDDAHLPRYARIGCGGLVSVAANVWPKATARYVELTLAGRIEPHRELWEKASAALFFASNPIPAKSLLLKKGWIRHVTLRLPLSERDLDRMDPLLEADRAVEKWYREL